MGTATAPSRATETAPSRTSFSMTLSRSVWREALAKLLTVISDKKLALPVISCVLIEVADDVDSLVTLGDVERPATIRLTGTDLDATLSFTIQAMVKGHGRIALPAKRLAEIAANLPDAARLTITVSDGTAKVTAGRARYEVASVPADEFPLGHPLRNPRRATVSAAAFLTAVSLVAPMARKEPGTEPYLTSVCLDTIDGQLVAVTSEGHALARLPIGEATGDAWTRQVLLPAKALPRASRVFGALAQDAVLEVAADDIAATLTAGETVLRLTLVGGQFAPYAHVIASCNTPAYTITCERNLLLGLLRSADVATDDRRRIELQLRKGAEWPELWALAASEKGGSAEDVILVSSTDTLPGAEPFRIAVSVAKLLTAIEIIDDAQIIVTFTTARGFIALRPAHHATPSDLSIAVVAPLNLE
jgi:DNA polymerase-3 subunit beta